MSKVQRQGLRHFGHTRKQGLRKRRRHHADLAVVMLLAQGLEQRLRHDHIPDPGRADDQDLISAR